MTTLYVFHSFIESTPTADTVISVFGSWWDGDATGGGGASLPVLYKDSFNAGMLSMSGGIR